MLAILDEDDAVPAHAIRNTGTPLAELRAALETIMDSPGYRGLPAPSRDDEE